MKKTIEKKLALTKNCEICGVPMVKKVKYSLKQWESRRYCSKRCTVKGTGNLLKGDNSGSNHYLWKGDKVGYLGLHAWGRKYIPKPALCECCGLVPPHDLANKGIYDRNPDNWEYLCRKCHMTKDGRIKNLLKTSFKPRELSV